jgi:hypothetical protein
MSSGGRVNELRTELLQVSPLVDEQASAGMDRTELISSHFESMLSMGAGLNNITSTDVLALKRTTMALGTITKRRNWVVYSMLVSVRHKVKRRRMV